MRKVLSAILIIIAFLLIAVCADASPRIKYSGIARDRAGNIVSQARVTVYLAGTTTAATVYSTETGLTSSSYVLSDTTGAYSFWTDAAIYSYTQKFKVVISKTGYTTSTFDDLFEAYLPENDIGCLKNDGSGHYSWGDCVTLTDIFPTDSAGYLLNDGLGVLSWQASVFPADDTGCLINDGAGNITWGDCGTLALTCATGQVATYSTGTGLWDTCADLGGEGTGDMLWTVWRATYDTTGDGIIDTGAIPSLAASKITSGTFDVARIPSLATTQITSGTFADSYIPSLAASKTTSGTFDVARIPSLAAYYDAAGTASSTMSTHQSSYNHALFLTGVVEANLSGLTDLTTANSSTSKHGLLPKLSGSAVQFMNGLGSWTTLSLTGAQFYGQGTNNYVLKSSGAASNLSFALVTEDMMSLSANTTLNATASKHGFLPMLSNNAAECLLGDGTWGACGTGAGDLLADGTIPLTADWDAGAYKITADEIEGVTSVNTTRADAPSIYRSYESTSDGNNYKDIVAPGKGIGFAANRTHIQGDYDSRDVLSTNVDTAGNIKYLQDIDEAGAISITGLTVTRAKTVRDAADTILEQGGSYSPTGVWNMSGATVKVPSGESLPGACTVGDMYMDTNATAGQRFYLCESTDTWALQGDGTGAAASVDNTAFGSSWNGVDTTAPTKNAVYDWAHTFDTDDDGKVNVLDLATAGVVLTDASGVVSSVAILTSANGGTGNGFTKFAGPTGTEKTLTVPDASNYLTVGNVTLAGPTTTNRTWTGPDSAAYLATGNVAFAGPTTTNRIWTGPDSAATLLTSAAAVTPAQGGTGVSNGTNNTITFTGNYTLGVTLTGNTAVTMPTSGTLATTGGNVATATALAGNPSDCAAGAYATTIDASGNLTCENIGASTPAAGVFTTLTAQTNLLLTSATAGARITGGNGLITFKGEGDGTDEDLTINLNSSNVATVSSSTGVTSIDFSALNLVTTGAIHGGIEIIADDTSLEAAQCYGSFNDTNGAETITLPTAVVGMNLCIYSNDATVKTIDPYSSEVIELNGTALTGGYAIKSPGAAGNFICLICRSAGVWTTLGQSGVWVTNGS